MGPSVLLRRDPWIEALLLYSSSDSGHLKAPPSKCFLCGKKGEWWSSCNGKWALFLTLLKGGDPSSEGPLISCPSCLALMKAVWDLEVRLKELRVIFDLTVEGISKEMNKKDGGNRNSKWPEIKLEVSSDEDDLDACFAPCPEEFDDANAQEPLFGDVEQNDEDQEEEEDSFQGRRSSRITRKPKKHLDSDSEDFQQESSNEDDFSFSDTDSSASETFEPPNPKKKMRTLTPKSGSGRKSDKTEEIKKPFSCSSCGKGFLCRRRKIHHEVFICKIKYEDPAVIEKNDIIVYKCFFDGCDYVASDASDFRKHYPRHKVTQECFLCSTCNASFSSKSEVNRHGLSVGHRGYTIKGNEEVMKDATAKARTNVMEVLTGVPRRKKEDVMPDGETDQDLLNSSGSGTHPHTCSVCRKGFARPNKKLKHEILVCGVKHDPEYLKKMKFNEIQCDQCQESFLDKARLIRHYSTHTGILPFGCSDCEDTFLGPDGLRSHLRNQGHSSGWSMQVMSRETLAAGIKITFTLPDSPRNIPGVEFKCGRCGEVFQDRDSRKRHYKNKHRPMHDTGICHICGKDVKRGLNRHVLEVHESVTPHECPHCGKKFFETRRLLRHVALHTRRQSQGKTSPSGKQKTTSGEDDGLLQAQDKPRKRRRVATSRKQSPGKTSRRHKEKTNPGEDVAPIPPQEDPSIANSVTI